MAEQKLKRSKRPEIQYYKPKSQPQQTTSNSEANVVSNPPISNPPKSGGQHSRRRRGGRNSGTDRGTDQGDDSTVGTLSFPSNESDNTSGADAEIATHSYRPQDIDASASHSQSKSHLSPSQSKSCNPKLMLESQRPVNSSEVESSQSLQKQSLPSRPVLAPSEPGAMPSQDVRCAFSSKSNKRSQISSEISTEGVNIHPGGLIQIPRELVASINQSMHSDQDSSNPEYAMFGGHSPRGAMRPKSSEKPTLVVRPTLSSRENPASSELCSYWNAASTSESQPGPSVERNLYPYREDDTVVGYTSPPTEELIEPLQAMNVSNWTDLLEDSETSNSIPASAPRAPVSSRNAPVAAPISQAFSSTPQASSPQSPGVLNTASYAAAARLTSPPQQAHGARSPATRGTGGSASSMVPIGHLRHSDSARSPRPDDSSSSSAAHASPPAQAALSLEGSSPLAPSVGSRSAVEPSAGAQVSRRSDLTKAHESYLSSTPPQSPAVNVLREVAARLLNESICVLTVL